MGCHLNILMLNVILLKIEFLYFQLQRRFILYILILELEEMMEPHILFDPMYDSSKPWQCTQCLRTQISNKHNIEHKEKQIKISLIQPIYST